MALVGMLDRNSGQLNSELLLHPVTNKDFMAGLRENNLVIDSAPPIEHCVVPRVHFVEVM